MRRAVRPRSPCPGSAPSAASTASCSSDGAAKGLVHREGLREGLLRDEPASLSSAGADALGAEEEQDDAVIVSDCDVTVGTYAGEQNGDVSVLDKVFGESWESRSQRRRQQSIYGAHEGWRLRPVIIKAGDDLRQEQFAMQLIASIQRMWQDAGLALRVRKYDILATSPSTGLMEMVADSISLAGLRKKHVPFVSLEAYYSAAYGDGSDGRLQAAQTNFVCSMAAYSIICYMLKVKDRHDGNILLQRDGSVVHIDWGYMLGRSMNAVLEVERAPFKLTRDHVAVMGGEASANFVSYISLCVQGLQVLRERGSEILDLVRAMNVGSALVCVNDTEVAELEDRLGLKYTDKQVVERFITLQGQALRSWSTGAYDLLQTLLGV
eukprot:Tamp_15568.p1 GENE.Tamp_15568~~Tamp_15568.p1  ORF type:complete len:396 (+),score=69.70 Tamp_15568:50-1189(+)